MKKAVDLLSKISANESAGEDISGTPLERLNQLKAQLQSPTSATPSAQPAKADASQLQQMQSLLSQQPAVPPQPAAPPQQHPAPASAETASNVEKMRQMQSLLSMMHPQDATPKPSAEQPSSPIDQLTALKQKLLAPEKPPEPSGPTEMDKLAVLLAQSTPSPSPSVSLPQPPKGGGAQLQQMQSLLSQQPAVPFQPAVPPQPAAPPQQHPAPPQQAPALASAETASNEEKMRQMQSLLSMMHPQDATPKPSAEQPSSPIDQLTALKQKLLAPEKPPEPSGPTEMDKLAVLLAQSTPSPSPSVPSAQPAVPSQPAAPPTQPAVPAQPAVPPQQHPAPASAETASNVEKMRQMQSLLSMMHPQDSTPKPSAEQPSSPVDQLTALKQKLLAPEKPVESNIAAPNQIDQLKALLAQSTGSPPVGNGAPPVLAVPSIQGVPPAPASGLHTLAPSVPAPPPEEEESEEEAKPEEEEKQEAPIEEPEEEKPPEPSTQQIQRFLQVFVDAFPPGPITWRQISRIGEFPLVRKNGNAADLAEIWPYLKGDGFEVVRERNGMLSSIVGSDFTIACGLGRGTVEIHVKPQLDLHALKDLFEAGMERLLFAAGKRKLKVLGYGIQPMTPPKASLLTHIYHIFSLHRAIGDSWTSASAIARDRVQISCGYEELLGQLNMGNLLDPAYSAIFANSPVFGGKDCYRANGKQFLLDQMSLADGRVGMPNSPYRSMEGYIEELLKRRCLLRRDPEGWQEPYPDSFVTYLNEDDSSAQQEQMFRDHVGFDWGSTIPVLEHGMIEFANACQQPWDSHMTVAALSLGLMESRADFMFFVDSFFPAPRTRHRFGLTMEDIMNIEMEQQKQPWPEFYEWRKRSLNHGLNTEEVFTGLLQGMLHYSQAGLEARGLGEEVYLTPLFERLASSQNPAQQLRRGFTRFGIQDLLKNRAIEPK